jgi:hypothetical protein
MKIRPEHRIMDTLTKAYSKESWWMGAMFLENKGNLNISVRGTPGSSPRLPAKINGVPILFTTKPRHLISKKQKR